MNKTIVDFVISINVHEKKNFLLKQLNNIKENVIGSYIVILNVNNFMFNELTNTDLDKNIIINNNYLEKKRFHGSLTEGIYSNMKFAIENYEFLYFIILSSRTFFFKNIDINLLNDSTTLKLHNNLNPNFKTWLWPIFFKTLLVSHYLKKANNNITLLKLIGSPHEGLTFNNNGCISIINFLESNPKIKHNLFNFESCVEEFALQTIVCHESDEGFKYIGSGVYDFCQHPYKYVYKIPRE